MFNDVKSKSPRSWTQPNSWTYFSAEYTSWNQICTNGSIYCNLYLSIHLSIYLPIYLSTYLPIDLPIYLSTYLSIYHLFSKIISFYFKAPGFSPTPIQRDFWPPFCYQDRPYQSTWKASFMGLPVTGRRRRGHKQKRSQFRTKKWKFMISNHLMQFKCLHTMLKQLFYDLF